MVENQGSTPDPSGGAPSDHLEEVEGVVKWFDPRKGFGFIVGPQGQDIFVHFQVIAGDGFPASKMAAVLYIQLKKLTRAGKPPKLPAAVNLLW